MDLFPDRAFVRLRNRVRRTYLTASENGWRVSLSRRRTSLNTAWRVHRVQSPDGVTYVLLHGAAYGKYLAQSNDSAPRGHRGRRAIQAFYFEGWQVDVLWEAERVGDHVRLRHVSGRLLRANGMYRPWNNGVSVHYADNQSMMTHWEVEYIPLRAAPPELPLPTPSPEQFRRVIVYEQTDDLEHDDPEAWSIYRFDGRSVSHLRNALANLLNEGNSANITLCTRSGFLGRPTPLVVDLPRSDEAVFVFVLTTGSPAAEDLMYPDVDA